MTTLDEINSNPIYAPLGFEIDFINRITIESISNRADHLKEIHIGKKCLKKWMWDTPDKSILKEYYFKHLNNNLTFEINEGDAPLKKNDMQEILKNNNIDFKKSWNKKKLITEYYTKCENTFNRYINNITIFGI